MTIETRALRPIPLGLSLATFLAVIYLGCAGVIFAPIYNFYNDR